MTRTGANRGQITGRKADVCSDPNLSLPEFPQIPSQNCIVIDTNIVLDLFVFKDPATASLQHALDTNQLNWLATPPMRDELARVLTYPQIVARLVFYKLLADDVLSAFDKHVHIVAVSPKASVTCSDADDQKFIDLAVTYKAMLLSKDKAVISMAKRLLALKVRARPAI